MKTALIFLGVALFAALFLVWSHQVDAIQGPFWVGPATQSVAPPAPPPTPPSNKVVIGGYMDMSCAAAAAYENWLGITPGSSVQIQYNLGPAPTNEPPLSQMNTYLQTLQCGAGSGRLQDVDVGIEDTVTNVLAGNYDTYIANIATAMNDNAPTSILRFDWEFNAGYICWYIGNTKGSLQTTHCGTGYTPTTYIQVFQHFVNIVRPIAPKVKISWVPNGCFTSCNGDGNDAVNAYPGDSYVDIIGIDHYDQWETGSGGSADWTAYYLSDTSHRALAWLASFAKTHGKAMGLETGIGASNLQNYSFNCNIPTPNTLCLNDTQGSQLWPFFANFVKNATSGGNGYQPFAYLDIWNTNEAHICTVTDGNSTCAGGAAPTTAGGVPPSSHSSDYMIPLTAQAYYTAFHGWQ